MKIGIVGLPNVGKSTLFNALTKSYSADAQNFPFTTIEPNVGIVDVKDSRLTTLAEISKTQKIVYATTTFVDIAGLVQGASKGEGLGNKFLSHIREVDMIVQVLRYFKDPNIGHVEGSVDPLRDVEIINTELIFSDLEQIERNLPALEKRMKSDKSNDLANTVSALIKAQHALQQGKLIYDIRGEMTNDELTMIKSYNLLTNKSFIYALNVGQEDVKNRQSLQSEFIEKLRKPVVIVCAALESEMLEFSEEEKKDYLSMLNDDPDNIPTLDDLINKAYQQLGLMYYFTTGEKETRAWSIPIGSNAPQAAAAIHTDLERGFIKAEVVNYTDFVESGGWTKAKEHGKLKLEGKDYIVKDGDIIIFKFNV